MPMSPAGKPGKNKGRSTREAFPRKPLNEGGYAYVMVLAAVVILGILAETAVSLISTQVKRDREEELLFRGSAYQQAIQDYYLSTPPGGVSYPQNLQDLLSDPRFPGRKRHIRILYPDPMGKDWNLVKGPGGVIQGVVSPSHEKPLKQAGFPASWASFEGAQHYSDWIFMFQPTPVGSVSQPQSFH